MAYFLYGIPGYQELYLLPRFSCLQNAFFNQIIQVIPRRLVTHLKLGLYFIDRKTGFLVTEHFLQHRNLPVIVVGIP